jgi:hypothetical protein
LIAGIHVENTLLQNGHGEPSFGTVDFSVADFGQRAGGEQAAQIAIALFADAAKLFPAPAREAFRGAQQERPGRSLGGSLSPSM